MPALDLKSAHEFWRDFVDPGVYRAIAFMESVEHFTLDGNPALEAEIKKLGEAFDTLDKFSLEKEEAFLTLCTHIKSSRILRMLQTIDTIDPGSASKLLMFAEEKNSTANPMASLFLKRNIAFERFRLLGRIFSEERIQLALKAMEMETG